MQAESTIDVVGGAEFSDRGPLCHRTGCRWNGALITAEHDGSHPMRWLNVGIVKDLCTHVYMYKYTEVGRGVKRFLATAREE